ncbi:NUDIX domain-containing protein [Emticicia sp. CRIBPO]|uniref:NUDIX domain-containing protein n=1 Tax=Emticicia sp. CRIBPO TaxID=2683258 RepID=UPI001411CE1B|nr:NUDIX hydrolase [Emticicia sp. CRIBPO]NBA87392.1 NUDIX domain-containing protein [Emticicia sp. CRIBPO]
MNIRPALVLLKEGKILTMRYRYGERDVYNLPGGNVDFGEGLKDTLIRELVEELNLEVSVGDLLFVAEVHLKEKQTLHCVFKGEVLSGEPVLNPEQTTAHEVCWLEPENLVETNLYPSVGEALKNALEGEQINWFLGKIDQKWF